ncbi:hypothetical protein MCUN1_001984 [Malassezia cuniculi]|uniref:Prokaryotic-type class I peptide chain release factors domain-containing protein n=1 Tax=Malassezia cuniculi TaxID=948313 RepID=A0AAF0EU86_9BASI|nr:hypothetical protein MCUN1_001984 [Malassezia cuniculi]
MIAPAADAPREVPTPLLFLSASRWTGSSPESLYGSLLDKFSQAGFTSLVLDVDTPGSATGAEKVNELAEEIRRCLRSPPPEVGVSPYPPVLIARHASCILAEVYASSNPLSALQLVDPPVTLARAPQRFPDAFPAEPDLELNFEAHFPVRVTWTEDELKWHADNGVAWYEAHRIEHAREDEAGECLDRYVWPTLDDGAQETLDWLENEVGFAAEHEAFEDEQDNEEVHSAPAQPTNEPPEWFAQGSYRFSPDGSKKMPLILDERHIQERFIRGSGPGGQAINKLSTNVELIHTPTGLRITCQATRSRQQNREFARRILSQKLEHLLKQTWHAGDDAPVRARSPSVLQSRWDKERKRKQNKKKKQRRRAQAED